MKLNITPKVFDGVYSSFNDVKESSYNNPDSLEEMFNETSNKLKLFLDGSYIPTNARSPISNLIPLLIALAFEDETEVNTEEELSPQAAT